MGKNIKVDKDGIERIKRNKPLQGTYRVTHTEYHDALVLRVELDDPNDTSKVFRADIINNEVVGLQDRSAAELYEMFLGKWIYAKDRGVKKPGK